MGTSRWLCELLGALPWHHPWSLQPRAEVGNRFPFGPVAEGCGPKSLQIAPGLVSVLETFANTNKAESRPSRYKYEGHSGLTEQQGRWSKKHRFYYEKTRFPEKLRFGVGPNCEKTLCFSTINSKSIKKY